MARPATNTRAHQPKPACSSSTSAPLVADVVLALVAAAEGVGTVAAQVHSHGLNGDGMQLQTWHELPAGCPTTIRIGSADFTIHANREEILGPDQDTGDAVGMTFSATHQIWLDVPSQSDVGIKLTLVHEVLHACIGESGTREFLPNLKPKHSEEAYVSVLSSPLFGVLIDNPKLLTYLTSHAKS